MLVLADILIGHEVLHLNLNTNKHFRDTKLFAVIVRRGPTVDLFHIKMCSHVVLCSMTSGKNTTKII